MKKLLLAILFTTLISSCVSIRFPETIKIDLSIPSDFDIDKMEVLIDTLRSKHLDGTIEILLHKKNKVDNKRTPPKLIIIDGKEQPIGTDVNNMDTNKIESINILKGDAAFKKYGEKSTNGVIEIITKEK